MLSNSRVITVALCSCASNHLCIYFLLLLLTGAAAYSVVIYLVFLSQSAQGVELECKWLFLHFYFLGDFFAGCLDSCFLVVGQVPWVE